MQARCVYGYFCVVVFWIFVVCFAHAQTPVPPHPVDGGFIKEWLILGPFFPDDLQDDLPPSLVWTIFEDSLGMSVWLP
jgi:hypothetical protein